MYRGNTERHFQCYISPESNWEDWQWKKAARGAVSDLNAPVFQDMVSPFTMALAAKGAIRRRAFNPRVALIFQCSFFR